MKESNSKYIHQIPPVPINKKALESKNLVLVESIEQLKDTLKLGYVKDFLAWDLETSGLDPEVDYIVGFSYALDNKTGYYVPLRHMVGNNLPIESLDIFYQALKEVKKRTFVYNMRFDYRFMEYSGYDMSIIPYYDVSVGIWLADTNYKFPSLKWASKHFMGWDMETFEQTLNGVVNFSYLTPQEAYRYASLDALSTFCLVNYSVQFWTESGTAGKLDNAFLYPFMKCEEQRIKIDVDYLKETLQSEQKELIELEKEIYSQLGTIIKINSNKQLGDALQRIGINTGKFTPTGQMKVDIKTLEYYNYKTPHPIINLLIKHSQKLKLITSYYTTLINESERMPKGLRFNYQTNNVPTSRLSSGSDKKNSYFAHMNVQAQPKPHPNDWYLVDELGEDKKNNISILGYNFSTDIKSNKVVEGFNQDKNIRKAYTVDDDSYWVSVDFSGQELRIIANYSNEPTWVNTFLTGGDLHKQMAISMWGKDNYNKELRKRAKCVEGNSLIITDSGIVPIKSLSNFREVDKFTPLNLKVMTNEGFKETEYFYYGGIKETRVIKTKKGRVLECSIVHPILTDKGWVESKDLSIGDKLSAPRLSYPNYNYQDIRFNFWFDNNDIKQGDLPFIRITENWGYFLGTLMGDGCISKSSVYYAVSDIDNDLLEYNIRVMKDLGLKPTISKRQKYGGGPYLNIIYCGSKRLIRFLNHLGVCSNLRKIIDVPKVILKSPLTVVCSFVRGLFDTDGTSASGDKIELSSKSKDFLNKIQLILQTLGIQSSVSITNKVKGIYYYKLKVYKESGRVFRELIGFESKRKSKGLDNFVNSYSGRDYNLDYDEVISIEESKAEVFDLTVKDNHNFISNGLVSHNTLNFGMTYGMTGRSLAEKFSISEEEGNEIVDRFWKAAPKIKSFQNACINLAKKKGTIYNYFGRPRRVRYWLSSSEPRLRAFGVRTVNNCYSPDTEFLTSNGWMLAKDITPDTDIAYYDDTDNSVKYSKAGKRYINKATNTVTIESDNVSLDVTLNHRMYIKPGNRRHYSIINASGLVFMKDFYINSACTKFNYESNLELIDSLLNDWLSYDILMEYFKSIYMDLVKLSTLKDYKGSLMVSGKGDVDKIQLVLSLHGISVSYELVDIEKDLHKVTYILNSDSYIDRKESVSFNILDYEVEYSCFSVPTGLLIVRRNGKIAICGNTVIQSVGAELLKRSVILLDKNLFRNPKYKDSVRFLNTVHDEINFEVKKDKVEEILPIILSSMEVKLEGWKVPIIAGIEIGDSWGRTFPFHFEDGKLVPTYEEVTVEEQAEEVKEVQEVKVEKEKDNLEFDWLD